ncbi:hypothetical protein EW146_g7128 [Bondarzewia mesenterica]|uniref:Uncharacterized protein n=1 Tax=Bondarzewia mesenterica TaxID=1095465 RepID=A0A4S4LNI9_9AGAM|nr:hypothetical protein EW146_g7128 [Bondarzewia mesenterica]
MSGGSTAWDVFQLCTLHEISLSWLVFGAAALNAYGWSFSSQQAIDKTLPSAQPPPSSAIMAAQRNVVAKQLYQNFIDEMHETIAVQSIHEKDITPDDISQLLRGSSSKNSPRSVGISPAYSKNGTLLAIALCVKYRVLIVQFYSSKPDKRETGGARAGRTSPARQLIERDILCNDDLHIYAFDITALALILNLQHQLHLTNGVDLQSAFPIKSRFPVDTVKFAVGDTAPVNSEIVPQSFEDMIWDPKKITDLALRAWLSAYVAGFDSESIRDFLYKAPRIDTTNLQLDASKPSSVTHEFTAEWNHKKKALEVQSQRYQNRFMEGENQRTDIRVGDPSEGAYVVSGRTSKVSGRRANLRVDGILDQKIVASITTIGPARSNQAEKERSMTVLRMLQGTQAISTNPWLQLIWQTADTVEWPESYLPARPPPPEIPVTVNPDRPMNDSQTRAVKHMLSPLPDTPITLIQGPPGTGKTTVIANYVLSAIEAKQKGIWLMAQSNVAVKNIAEKLASIGFFKWRLLVSKEFHHDWHEHLYLDIARNIIPSDQFPRFRSALSILLDGSQVILCTLSMVSSARFRDAGFTKAVPLTTLIIDEASQIQVGDFVHAFTAFDTIRKVCFIGDDKQLPPHGQEEIESLESIFEKEHLRSSAIFLDTQYRMPPQIGGFISQHVYDDKLKSNPLHPIKSATMACHFIDIPDGLEQRNDTSWKNIKEIEASVLLARRFEDEGESFRIITPYDAQRNLLETALKEQGLVWQDKCFNVDSFQGRSSHSSSKHYLIFYDLQGNEDDIIIISLVRSKELGFLSNLRRTNVMLTRCKRGMYICSSRKFLEGRGKDSLAGKMAAKFGDAAWMSWADLVGGNF